jgi:hypothetical protein
MKIYGIIILLFVSSCSRLLANGDKMKGLNVEHQDQIIKNILEEGINTEKDERKIKDAYKNLVEIGTYEAGKSIIESFLLSDNVEEKKLLYLLGLVLKEVSSDRKSNLYREVNRYIEEGEYSLYIALSILKKINKPKVFDYLVRELYNELHNKDNKSPFDGPFKSKNISTLPILWRLAELRDKRIIEFLKDYKSRGIREDLAIALAYCMINHEYEKNLNFILNSFEESINKPDVYYPVDDFLSHIKKIGNPEVIDFLEKNKYNGLLVDCYELDLDNIIKELKKNEGLIQRHHIEVTCSSTLIDKDNKFLYDIDNIFDNDDNTAWVEGAEGDGIGEWVQFDFDKEYKVGRIDIISGYSKSRAIFKANNRIKNLELIFSDGSKISLDLKDTMDLQQIKIEPRVTKSIKFVIKDVYKGSKYKDACISEMKLWESAKEVD